MVHDITGKSGVTFDLTVAVNGLDDNGGNTRVTDTPNKTVNGILIH
jgi:hypothetical protein